MVRTGGRLKKAKMKIKANEGREENNKLRIKDRGDEWEGVLMKRRK